MAAKTGEPHAEFTGFCFLLTLVEQRSSAAPVHKEALYSCRLRRTDTLEAKQHKTHTNPQPNHRLQCRISCSPCNSDKPVTKLSFRQTVFKTILQSFQKSSITNSHECYSTPLYNLVSVLWFCKKRRLIIRINFARKCTCSTRNTNFQHQIPH